MRMLTIALAASLFALPAHATLDISTKPTKNMDCSGNLCVALADDAVLNVGELEALLSANDMTVETEGAGAQDMEILAPLRWSSGHALTLASNDAIIVRRAIAVDGVAHLTLNVAGGPLYREKGAIHIKSLLARLTIDGDDYVLVSSVHALDNAVAMNPSGFYALTGDYDASADGTYTQSAVTHIFEGHFDGLGNTISNLSILTHDGFAALFVRTRRSSTLRNLGLENANVEGDSSSQALVGVLAALGDGTIVNCHATGAATAGSGGAVGGLIGIGRGFVSRSWADVQVTVLGEGEAGGLIGIASGGQVSDSYALGDVSSAEQSSVGGLIGENHIRARASYASGHVTGGSFSNVGGAYGTSAHKSKFVYWNADTGGPIGVGMGNSNGVTGLTAALFKAALPDGFGDGAWAQDGAINNGFPYLVDNPPR